MDSPGGALPATGERTVPGLAHEEYWFARHEVAYRWIADHVRDRHLIVDAGAGEGYGAALLGCTVALEYDGEVCRHIRSTYPDVSAVRANLASLPLRTACVDAVACCQVVEHLWDLAGFLRDCHRVLRTGGELIVTTPQRLTFSPGLARGEKPVNPFHVEEFDAEQLHDLLVAAGFTDVQLRGVRHGTRIADWEAAGGSLVAAQVEAATTGVWPDGLRAFVETVTASDFDIDARPLAPDSRRLADAEDLLAIATVP